jgi:hypothetical protein
MLSRPSPRSTINVADAHLIGSNAPPGFRIAQGGSGGGVKSLPISWGRYRAGVMRRISALFVVYVALHGPRDGRDAAFQG